MLSQLLNELLRAFLFLRDLFGYFVPGGVFVGLVAYSDQFQWKATLQEGVLPKWLLILFLLASMYILGHLSIAVGHAIQDLVKYLLLRVRGEDHRKGRPTLRHEHQVLYYRLKYPKLFIELDRRATLALLRTGVGASLLVGGWLFFPSLFFIACEGLAVAFLLTGYSGRMHVELYRVATLRAAFKVERNDKKG